MGIAVSSWQLAKEVSIAGELGVISGTAIDSVVARRLQDGDLTGDIRRAMAAYPHQETIKEIMDRFFIEGGREDGKPYLDVPKLSIKGNLFSNKLLAVASFVEVWLAKEGHNGLIGMNILEKIQLAIPAQLYGAMLADVDYILIGAGIPAQVPHLLNEISQGNKVAMKVDVADTKDKHYLHFDPRTLGLDNFPIKRPLFLAIVTSHALVAYLNKDEETKPDGYVIEYHVAGGHNAPPRAKNHVNDEGEAVYNELDIPNLEKIHASGSPFWLAGGYATPEKVKEAISYGAQGVQVGSLFALANESGFTNENRSSILVSLADPTMRVMTDASASPTGFPFKVIQNNQTLSNDNLYKERTRICDLGYLRTMFQREKGGIGYRCPAEPLDNYEFKNGEVDQAQGSKCLCNALMADIGLGQVRPDGRTEISLLTFGSDLDGPRALRALHPDGWNAVQALNFLKSAI
ncbi:COG2070 Dioxygenases related to 2-nitropropane dioxygenase [Candidatus Nanopelagicaceae bacterium]